MNPKYTYQYFLTNLADGTFNPSDEPLGKMLKDGWKPLRETPVGNTGYVLLVLSKQVEND